MALTRAQLLMGNASQGTVLAGDVQGVRQGAGLIIAADGTISFDSATATGILKTNNPSAYNAYVWPSSGGAAGQQLTSDGAGNLTWGAAGGSFTAKGQLNVGTGVGTDTLLNVGTNTAFLVADSSTTSGLKWSSSSTSAAQMPAGNTGARPSPAAAGQIRFNTTTGKFEFSTGPGSWEQVASGDPTVSGFVSQSVPSAPALATGNAIIPSGSTTQRQTSPVPPAGSTRYNTTTGKLEVLGNGSTWETVPSSSSGDFVGQTVPTTGSASAVIPSGVTGDRQTVPLPLAGYTRFNTTTTLMEVFNGLIWTSVGAPPNAGLGLNLSGVSPNEILKVSIPQQVTPPVVGTGTLQAIDGSMYWDSTLGQLFIRYANGGTPAWVAAAPPGAAAATLTAATQAEAITGTITTAYSTPATAVAKTTADQTGFVVTPKSAVAPATTGYLHYNTTSNHIEYFAAAAAKTVVEREGDNMTGKLSVTPSAIAAGVGGWLLTTSNYWTVGALAFPLPTGLSAGQGGLIQMSAAPTSWPAGGGILKYTGGTAPAPTAFPAILPYYSDGTNVYLGKATENIS